MTWADDLAGMADDLGDLVTTEPVLLAAQAAACHQLLAGVMQIMAQENSASREALFLRERVRPYIDLQREVMASHDRRREQWLRDHPEAREGEALPGTFPES